MPRLILEDKSVHSVIEKIWKIAFFIYYKLWQNYSNEDLVLNLEYQLS